MPQVTQKPKMYVGIDPGASGGMAFVGSDPTGGASVYPLGNQTRSQIWGMFCMWSGGRVADIFAVVEKNTGFVGGVGNPGSAMFQFGLNTGILHGFLVAAGIPYEEVTPSVWQRVLGVSPRKKTEAKGKFKARLKQHAEQLFPDVKLTLATCDALLIAEFCRRKREGKL